MASFVETATLKVVDDSTKQIRKINKALADLYKTADRTKKSLGSMGTVRVNASQVSKATNTLTRLGRVATTTKQSLSMAVNVRTISISGAMRNLTALQNRALSTRRALQGLGGVSVGGGRGGPRGPGQNNNQRVILDYGGFRGFASGFMTRLGTTIESSIIRGFQQGTRDTDLAQNRQRILGFTPEQRRVNNRTATELAAENPSFSRAQILAVMGEVAPSVGNDPTSTRAVTKSILEYSKALVAAGATSEAATDNLQKLSKAMGMTSTLLDNAGNFDAAAMKRFMDVVVQETITGGREMTPELIAQLAKYSRTTGKTLDQEGWRTLLFLGEDYGSSAGVGLNQMVKQLTGERIQKKQLARLMELGLMGSKEVKSGTVGGKVKTETVATGTIEEALLRANPAKWVRDVLMPIMAREGIDATDNIQAAKFAGQITSDRTATDILTTLITNMGEVMQRERLAKDRGDVNLDMILEESLIAQIDSTATQLTSAMGEVANSMKSMLIPALKAVGSVAQSVAAFVAGDSGEGNVLGGATVAAGAGAVGFAGYKAFSTLMDGFGLKSSAVALDGSAAALTRAAIALGGAGAVDGALPGGKKKPRGPIARAARYAGIGTGIGTGMILADQIVLGGAGADKIEKNVNYLEVAMSAWGRIVNELFRPKEKETAENGVPRWKSFLFGAAADPMYPGFREHVRSGFTTTSDDAVAQFGQEVAQGAIAMQTAIDASATGMATKIEQSAVEFGPAAGAGLLLTAGSWGAAAGSAFRQSIGNIPVTVNQTPAVDTGNNENGMR